MRSVSNAFNEAVKKDSRLVKARATFEVLNVDVRADITSKTASTTNSQSSINQTYDNLRYPKYKFVTNEQNYTKLDGSYRILDNTASYTKTEVGWWSDNLSDTNCIVNETLTYQMTNTHELEGFGILFDREGESYATDFTVSIGDKTYNATNNNSPYWRVLEHINNINTVTINFTKINKPNQRVKVLELDFGIVEDWTDEEIISAEIVEEISATGELLPTDSLKITVDNSDRRFNILEPTGIYKYLEENKRLDFYFGAELEDGGIEWCYMGDYYLVTPKVEEGSMTASFECKSYLGQIENIVVDNFRRNREIWWNRTFWDFYIKHILYYLGTSNYNPYGNIYNNENSPLASKLKNTHLQANNNDTTMKELLQNVSVTTDCIFKPKNHREKGKIMEIRDLKTEPLQNITIDLSNALEVPSIEVLERIKDGYVNYVRGYGAVIDRVVNVTSMIIKDNEYTVIDFGNVLIDTITFTSVNGEIITRTEDSTHTLQEAGYVNISYETKMTFNKLYIKRLNGTGTMTLTNCVFTINGSEQRYATHMVSSNESAGKSLEYSGEYIESYIFDGQRNMFDEVANNLLNQPTHKLISNWRGNPALETCDKILIEDGYGELRKGVITKQTFKYEGYLRANTEISILKGDI